MAAVGARALQVAHFRERMDKLPRSAEIYNFEPERKQLKRRIDALRAGQAVCVQAWELADALVPLTGLESRWDQSGPRVFMLTEKDELKPYDYERLTTG